MLEKIKSVVGALRSARIFVDIARKRCEPLECYVGENIGSTAPTKLDKIKSVVKDEGGYLLIESLLALILLSIVAMSLITVLPILMDTSARLDKEQAIYHQLSQLHDQEMRGLLSMDELNEFDVFQLGDELCKHYVWRDGSERTICL